MREAPQELVERARRGDGWAFEQLVHDHERSLLSLALDMVGSVADAQDVYQEALLAAFRGLPRFRGDSQFSTWLYRIVVHEAQRHRDVVHRAAAEARHETAEAADEGVLTTELAQQLRNALDELSGQERTAFVLCHRQGMRVDHAAALMECSAGAVKSYLFRGRAKVRTALAPYLER
jgi:RNA polymerase sigma-70 factor (ECF subfamily)